MASHVGPHKYIRVKVGKNKRVFVKCDIPGCPHYLKHEVLALGRMSICNRCGDEMILTKLNMQLAKPHCDACTKSKKEGVSKIAELLERMQ